MIKIYGGKMELSIRLEKIASLVEKCDVVADIGTDHGYIPIYLLKNKKCNKAIASDVNKGPVERAKLNMSMENLSDRVECRLGNGMKILKPNEAQGVIVAGMGGNLIRDIIEDSMDIFKKLNFAVLQPVQNPEVLRKYIFDKGFEILDEDLCYDENKFYEIMKVRYSEKPRKLDDIYYEISELLIKKKHHLLKKYIEFKINKYNIIFTNINENSTSFIVKKQEVENKIVQLQELLRLCC